MIVVVIIGILAAVAIPKFADMMRKSKEANTKAGLANLRSTLTIYSADHDGQYPTDRMESLIPKYIEVLPTAKFGAYHPDTDNVRNTNPDLGCAGAHSGDLGEWAYCNQSEADRTAFCGSYDDISWGKVWVHCDHTDLKNSWISNW